MRLLYPDLIFKNIGQIAPDTLLNRGVRGVLLDLDGTICRLHAHSAEEDALRWIRSIQDAGIKIMVFSNNKSSNRVERVSRAAGISMYMHRAGKPFSRGFVRAAQALGLPPSDIAVVGDQVYTDVLGGNRAGMTTVFVHTIDLSVWYVKLRYYIAERPFVKDKM